MFAAKQQQSADGIAAAIECRNQLPALDAVLIDHWRRDDAMRLTERLDPPAPGVMNVGSDRAKRSPGNAWDRSGPELTGQILDEKCRHSIVGVPGGEDDLWKRSCRFHGLRPTAQIQPLS